MSFYNDASLIFLAGAAAGKDGKAYNVKPVPVYGPELVVNGDFATDSDWTKGTSWSIGGGVATYDKISSGQELRQLMPSIAAGKTIEVKFDISNIEATKSAYFKLDCSGSPESIFAYTLFSEGTYTYRHKITGGFNRLTFTAVNSSSQAGAFSIDNISVKEIRNDADFDFSRGSNLSATRVGPDGLIEKGRENLLTYSNDFSQWTKSGATAASGESGYDGSSDAWLITKSGGAFDQILRNVSSSGVNTISFYAKAGTLTSVYFRGQASSNIPDVKFNLSDGSLTSSTNVISASSEDIGSGWYRLKMTFSNTITNVTIYPDFGQTTAGTIYIQDAQSEIGLAATDYIESGASTGKAGLLENEPRFDYSGGVTCPSLLKEKPRTNLITQSEYFGGYSNSNSTDEPNATTSPEGLTNATSFLEAATTGQHKLATSISFDGSNTYTFSVFAKSNGRDLYVDTQNSNEWGGRAWFDLTAGTANAVLGTADIEDYGNGWHRCIVTGASTLAGGNQVELLTSDGSTNSTTGDITKGVYIYGAQLEQASYPTSYIPNHSGGTITRGGETANYVTVGGGSEKWSLMYEFDFNKTPLQQNEIFSTIRSLPSNNVAITFRHFTRDSVKHVISPYFNLEPAYPFGSSSASSVTDSSVLLRANGDGSYDYFASLNGVVTKASVTGMSNIAFNRIDLGPGASSAHKKVILFANTLSDADCTALIGTSYDTFADMAEALNYTVYE